MTFRDDVSDRREFEMEKFQDQFLRRVEISRGRSEHAYLKQFIFHFITSKSDVAHEEKKISCKLCQPKFRGVILQRRTICLLSDIFMSFNPYYLHNI